MQEVNYIKSLDGVRGIAILLVLFAHTTVLIPKSAFDEIYTQIAWTGWIGVDLFFCLSGFLITRILLSAKSKPDYFKNFYARRFLRIFPLFYLIVFICLVILPHIPHPKANNFGRIAGDEIYYWTYLSNFIIAIRQQLRHGILDASWSLSIEEQFYMLWPLIIYWVRNTRLLPITLGLAVVALITRILIATFSSSEGWWYYTFYFTCCRWDGLALGGFLAYITMYRQDLVDKLLPYAVRISVLSFLSFVAVCLIEGGDIVGGVLKQTIGLTFLIISFTAFILIATTNEKYPRLNKVLTNKTLMLFGKHAYAIYLINLPVRAVIRDVLYKPGSFLQIGQTQLPGQIIFYIISIPTILFCSWVIWHTFEKHFLKLKKYF
ncbi:MAG: acyltransferase [Saprospiraceae bacterium]|nr:acyltransferase [Saprospiraceae bacterium]